MPMLACALQSGTTTTTEPGFAGLHEFSVSQIVIQIISAAVVGHDQIGPAVIVEILPGGREAIEQVAVFHTCLPRDIAECAVTVIVIQAVWSAFQPSRARE